MNKKLNELLAGAKGASDLAIFVDVRGFSSFSTRRDSRDVVNFVKHIYTKILRDYFPTATFVKPTGDGLMIIFSYGENEDNVTTLVKGLIDTCQKLVQDFETFCADNPVLNFDVPKKIGIGMSRGSAHKLVSGDEIVDYSGHVLNLAARLMELARPAGLILDASVIAGVSPLPESLRDFTEDKVYPKGVAGNSPVSIHVNSQITAIPMEYRTRPETKKKILEKKYPLESVIKLSKDVPGLEVVLDGEPADLNSIKADIRIYPPPATLIQLLHKPLTPSYLTTYIDPTVSIALKEIVDFVSKYPYLQPNQEISIRVQYLEPNSSAQSR
ncbi:MAG: adenylate/guanylate cyclase domain-containing protein [Candidatus Bathyarchaeia archaeon]